VERFRPIDLMVLALGTHGEEADDEIARHTGLTPAEVRLSWRRLERRGLGHESPDGRFERSLRVPVATA